MHGNTPLTKRLLKPTLIDAKTGKLTDMRSMPWYVNALFVAEPLHFGDYGGLPLKIIWALFDRITIVVLISGLYLWFARNKATKAQLARLEKTKAATISQHIEDAKILTLNLHEEDTHD